jgi:3-isopropylmalate dehydrogenase
MSTYRIAALPGDGIGPEVLESTLQVLHATLKKTPGLKLEINCYEAGAELYRKSGVALPSNVLDACLAADAVLLAAIGLPDVRKPDGTEVQPEMMMGLRRALNVYAAVRPVKLFPGVVGPLRTDTKGIDMVIIRENLEGLFASFGGGSILNDTVATDTIVITREGTERVVDYAFQLARRRQGRPLDRKRSVTCVDKANVFRSFAFFRKVFFDVAQRYPDVSADATYVDAMSLYMVQNPAAYDVLVMENQFGDILSDLGAGIVGGLGLGPSGEIGDEHALFQPSHGTAPQLAGKNVANPIATILSASMMLDWLGHRHSDPIATSVAQRIESAVSKLLKDQRVRTADLGGQASTSEVTFALIEILESTKTVDLAIVDRSTGPYVQKEEVVG